MEVIAPSSITASERAASNAPAAAPDARTRARRITDVMLIAIFCAGLCLPLIGVSIGSHGWDTASRADRRKSDLPVLLGLREARITTPAGKLKAVAKFPGQFKYYLADHFGFRNLLIRLHGLTMVKGLGVTSSSKVVLGQDGWLFLADEGSLEDYRHTDPMSPEQLEEWRQMLETRQKFCAVRGIPYLVVFAPSKHSIYPEEMPPRDKPAPGPSRLDQLLAYMRERHSPVQLLDLRPALLTAKRDGVRLYHKTDTHWNDRGAWAAYQAVMAAVRKDVPLVRVLSAREFEPVTTSGPGMDLAGLLGLNDQYVEQSLDLKPRIRLRLPHVEQDVVEPFTVAAGARGGPGVVVFRDSFFTVVLPWLAESFGRGAYFWEYGFDAHVIEAEHPAIVIQEIAERKLSLPASKIDLDHLNVRLVDQKWVLVPTTEK
jgi:alginate O-acetyltransferase complex protein AlgJ